VPPVTAVVHLVWGPLGLSPVREFLSSYRRYGAGIEHELVVLLNNVEDRMRAELEAELEGVEHRLLEIPEPVQDLTAYAQAAERLEHRRLCFLNSYSTILAHGWLEKLSQALDQPGVGLVGATGSWASLHSAVLNVFFLPNPYRGVFPDRKTAGEQMRVIELELENARMSAGKSLEIPDAPPRTLLDRVIATLRSFPPMAEQLLRFGPFPDHHLRTNAFMVERSTFTGLRMRTIRRKTDAYLLESGRSSFTRQVQSQGLRTLVVDRDGSTYDHDRWDESRTFWQGDQERLLIADNQTRIYSYGEFDRRRLLSAFAWGPRADPVVHER
jgi:hypothetical protein